MGFIKIWVLQLFNPYIYCLVQPLFCKEITGHTRKWVEENQPNIEQSLVKRFEGKHFLDFFLKIRSSFFPFFSGKPWSWCLCWSGGCNDFGERKKKKKKGQMKRKSKIFVELETDAGGRKRYGLFSPWIFYLPSVNHPYKNGRQQGILKLERSLSHIFLMSNQATSVDKTLFRLLNFFMPGSHRWLA